MTAKEALDVFGNIRFLEIVDLNEAKTAIEILKELVERDTPIKVGSTIGGFSHVDYHCPKCKEYVGSANSVRQSSPYNYCPYCGQRLEWKE